MGVTEDYNDWQKSTETQITNRINTININLYCIDSEPNTSIMKYTLCYMILLFAAQTDNIAGILRSLRDVNHTPYYLEPKNER